MSKHVDIDTLKIPSEEIIAKMIINSAPSIDIVRCGECKYAHMTDDGYCKYCEQCKDEDGFLIEVYHDKNFFCGYGERRDSEKPNNCEHITEDGVTCAKYPACDDCPDNPLNKVKGSERLVKGSEVTTDCRQLERSRR